MKRLALALLLSAVGCAAQLATLPPSDTYVIVEGDAPHLTKDEQRLFDAINKELARLGLPTATLGSHEQNAAAIMANAALAKIWHGSGRAIAQQDPAVIAPPVSGQEGKVEERHQVEHGRLGVLTDEEDDAQIKHLHTGQHLTAHGIPPNVRVRIYAATYAETTIEGDAFKNLVRDLRPRFVSGELKLGVVILPVGDADQRLFAVAIRDRTFDLSKAPQRFATPGSTFEVAGTVYNRSLTDVKLALQGPDGKVSLNHAPVDPQGNFSTSMTIPNAPGLYVFGAGNGTDTDSVVIVPIFAGISPTPWPVSADPKEAPIDGTRSLAQRLAKGVAEWRHSHGLSAVPIDAGLSAYAKSEASLYAKAADASGKEGSGTPEVELNLTGADRAKAAGFDPKTLGNWGWVYSDSYLADFFARFPDGPFIAARFSSPSVEKLGVGVVLVPNDVTKDSDDVRYCFHLVLQDPTPPTYEPKALAVSTEQPLTVAIRSDGSMAVDGSQVDEARLKQRIDQARAVNPDVTVILQVELGAKPELVQHVTEVIKAEGVVSIVSHPPEPPAAPPPAPAPTKSW